MSKRGKFILGYIKGSKSVHGDRPKVYWHIKISHEKKEYEFQRLEQSESGVFLPKLRIYDADNYPLAMLEKMIELNYIVFL